MAKRGGTVRPLRAAPPRWTVAYIGIGSNQGDRGAFCREAVDRIGTKSTVRIKKVSSLYETEPMEYLDQDWFYNAVIEIETSLSPLPLLRHCQKIENALGKKIAIPKGPRTIDLDLLFYDQKVMSRPGLTLPHPAAAMRPFVLMPLSEIAPDFVHPVLRQTASRLLAGLSNRIRLEKKKGPGWEKERGTEERATEEKRAMTPIKAGPKAEDYGVQIGYRLRGR